MPEPILALRNVEAQYGPIKALHGVSFAVDAGSVVAVLGANGAGKSTTLKTICGLLDPSKGGVIYDDQAIDGRDPDRLVRMGITYVPEGREVFPFLSVRENLQMGAYTRRDIHSVEHDVARVLGYFPTLEEKLRVPAGQLSGGQQQMLAIGRAIMARPKLMLLDEPSLGLSPLLANLIFEIITRINQEEGVTIIVAEQNARAALGIADHGFVMELGRIVLDDTAERLQANTDVREFYLGKQDAGVRGERRWKKRKVWR